MVIKIELEKEVDFAFETIKKKFNLDSDLKKPVLLIGKPYETKSDSKGSLRDLY